MKSGGRIHPTFNITRELCGVGQSESTADSDHLGEDHVLRSTRSHIVISADVCDGISYGGCFSHSEGEQPATNLPGEGHKY